MDPDQYAKYISQITVSGYTSLLLSLGYELGLFRTMMKENRPVTSQELAERAGMKERYVREWLHGVSTGQIISYNSEDRTFYIPESHHKALLATSSYAVGISALVPRMPAIRRCFMKDGPHGLNAYENNGFWEWFSEMRKETSKEHLDEVFIPGLTNAGFVSRLESGINVLDVCCGSAEFTIEFARRFPKSSFLGIELFEEPLATARNRVSISGLENVNIVKGVVLDLPDEMAEKFDAAFFTDALHDIPDPAKALAEVRKTLVPGGFCIIYESAMGNDLQEYIGNLNASHLYTWSILNCLPSGLATEPRLGEGVCWGQTNVEKVIRQHFSLEAVLKDVCKSLVTQLYCLYICKK